MLFAENRTVCQNLIFLLVFLSPHPSKDGETVTPIENFQKQNFIWSLLIQALIKPQEGKSLPVHQ